MSERPAPRLRTADRSRVVPAMPLDDLVPHDHPARSVWSFCEALDLSAWHDSVRSRLGGPGHPAADPRVLIALWLFATLEGVSSARQLADLCLRHHAFLWLAGGVSLNHHTLSDFRVAHAARLDGLLTHSVAALCEQGLADLNRLSADGVRVRASAGAASFHRRKTLEEHLAEAREQVERLKAEADEPDRSGPSRRERAARERAARDRAARLEAALKRMPEMEARKKAGEKDKARVSSTDPGATVMKMADGGYRPAYNLHVMSACGSGLVTAVEVRTTGSDMGGLCPLLKQTEERTGVAAEEVLADGGFAALADIEEAAARGAEAYVPVPAPKDGGRDRHARMGGDSEAVGGWRERMGTGGAKEVYKERAATSEWVNAGMRNRGLVRLLVRGVEKVRAVLLWHALAHNVMTGWRLRAEAVPA